MTPSEAAARLHEARDQLGSSERRRLLKLAYGLPDCYPAEPAQGRLLLGPPPEPRSRDQGAAPEKHEVRRGSKD